MQAGFVRLKIPSIGGVEEALTCKIQIINRYGFEQPPEIIFSKRFGELKNIHTFVVYYLSSTLNHQS